MFTYFSVTCRVSWCRFNDRRWILQTAAIHGMMCTLPRRKTCSKIIRVIKSNQARAVPNTRLQNLARSQTSCQSRKSSPFMNIANIRQHENTSKAANKSTKSQNSCKVHRRSHCAVYAYCKYGKLKTPSKEQKQQQNIQEVTVIAEITKTTKM